MLDQKNSRVISSTSRSARSFCNSLRSIRVPVQNPVLKASTISRSPYIDNHLSESIQTWTMDALYDCLSFHEFGPQGPCPGMGLDVKIEYIFKIDQMTCRRFIEGTDVCILWSCIELVELILYVHSQQLRSCQDGRLSLPNYSWTSLPKAVYQYIAHILSPFTDNGSS